jgi:arsenate reductase
MTDITLYHNPRCSKSRQTLELLKARDLEPEVVLYLETPPDAGSLTNLIKLLGISAHDILRTGEAAYDQVMAGWSDEKIFKAIEANPILLQRPIVVANGQARIGRPPESVLEIV